ncbi:hypothetical protein G7Z17_g11700 [Cylindrodendrum hubeiense]|uniref:Kinesin light chain n=1 Tax=Cylindrodendrum hubeiense TaxID=595255 RepID=A0A9P5GX02_9HYPO|nr:hypothetical protein G7Z17_g11700 [Cylindrodendrum hubeiense]
MAEAVGLTASVIAIIDLSAKVAVLCLDYSTAVGNARVDIERLQRRLNGLGKIFQGARKLLGNPSSQALATSRGLVDSVDSCTSELAQLQSRLDPSKARKAMRRFGLRALKWPFHSKEISDIISNLEGYEQTITFGLQIDQTTLLLNLSNRIEGVSLQTEEDVSIARKPCFSLPFERDPDFVDRPEIMAWIKEQYALPIGRIALVGMGGFGERRLAHWLMVLDNIDDVNLFYPNFTAGRDGAIYHPADESPAALSMQRPLAVFLPKCRNGIILVTSRSMDAAEKLTGSHKAIYRIVPMDDAQALQLFRKKLPGDSNKDATADLLRTLDYIPLAITQAAAYMNRRVPRISAKTYLEAFRESDKNKSSLLNSDTGDLRRDETVSNSVITTWQVTFEQIRRERPSAANLLSLMSFFNPQGIPEFVLHNYKENPRENAYGVDDDEENLEFEDDLDVLRGYSLVSVTAKRDFLASTYYRQGRLEEAEELQVRVMETMKCILGDQHPVTLSSMYNLASMYYHQGRLEEAEELLLRAMEIGKNVLGEQHPDTLSSMSNLASTYYRQGRLEEAGELDLRVMEARNNVLGEQHPDTLSSMTKLAITWKRQGRSRDGLTLMRNRVGLQERVVSLGFEDRMRSTFNSEFRFAFRYQSKPISQPLSIGRSYLDKLVAVHPFTLENH